MITYEGALLYRLQCGDISFQEYLRLTFKIIKHTMSIDEVINILNSYKRNETIQYYDAALNEWLDIKNYNQLLYYIANGLSLKAKKPQRYYPYENTQEFLADSKIHGPYIKSVNNDRYEIPTYLISGGIECGELLLNWESLMREYIWQDATPVGKLKDEL